jgi:hypothetical protein
VPKTKQTMAVAGVKVREGCEMGSKQEQRWLGMMGCCAEVRRSNRNEMRVRARCEARGERSLIVTGYGTV